MDELTVGIDIGTTSVKGVLVGADGRVLERTRVVHGASVPAAESLEHDAGRAWRRGPRRVLRTLTRPGVKGVAVAAMVPSLCAVNRRGVPQTPGLLYGDARGRTLDPDAKSGTGGEAIGFLAWTAQQAPDAAGYWPAQAVANHALAGVAVMDNASAAACYPLYDGTGWAPGLLDELAVGPERMPEVLGFGQPAGTIDGEAVLASGLVDAIGEQVVADATEPGDVLVICGSTLITWAVLDEWREVPGLLCIPHTVPGKFLLGGPSNAGGLFLDWVGRLVGTAPTEIDPAEQLPVWAPYPRGERTPLDDPWRRARLDELDLTHGPGAVRRAAREASGFVVRRILGLAGVRGERVVATGGGIQDPAWMQALADCTGLPVDLSDSPDGAARGAAFVARVAAGLEPDVAAGQRWGRTARRVDPDPAGVHAAAERYERFHRLAG